MPEPSCRLYLVTPAVIADLRAFAEALSRALDAGDVAALQIRLKDASDEEVEAAVRALGPIARDHSVALILNDRPDLASSLDCDGVHIGQHDGPIALARRLMGSGRIVGVTCHDSRDLAIEAAEAGADYVAFGAFFPTQTKLTRHTPDLEILSIWQETMLTPCVAIGGVTPDNCPALAAAGADFLAVSAGVWRHPSGPATAVVEFNRKTGEGLARRPAP